MRKMVSDRLWTAMALAIVLTLALPWAAFAAVWTDLPDYSPGSVVSIFGDNSDGAGYVPGESVYVEVLGPNGYAAACEGIADAAGAWSCQVTLWDNELAIGEYSYTATGQNVTEAGTFTDDVNIASFLATDCNTESNSFASGAQVCAKATGLPGGGSGTSGKIEWWAPAATTVTRTTTFTGAAGNFPDTWAPAASPNPCGTWTLKVYTGGTLRDEHQFQVTGCAANTPPIPTPPGNQNASEGTSTAFALGSFVDPDGGPWSVDVNWGDGSAHITFSMEAAGTITAQSHTYADNGSYTVTVRVTDSTNLYDQKTFQVTVSNVAPTATFAATSPIDEGGSSTLSFTSPYDPSSADTTAGFHYSFACDGLDASLATTYLTAGTSSTASCTFNDNGTFTVKGRIFDKDDGYNTYSATVTVNNVAPAVNAGGPYSGNEGSAISFTFSCTDPGVLDTWTASVNWGDGTPAQSLGAVTCNSGTFNASHTYADDNPTGTSSDTYSVSVSVTDDDLGTGTGTATATVYNVAPDITKFEIMDGGGYVFPVNTPINFLVEFTDPGTEDTWECELASEAGTVDPSCTSPANVSMQFSAAGIYNVSVEVTDDDGGEDSSGTIMIVIYDPNAGFVTGGGWIYSPGGAYKPDTTLEGKATFGFVSKYLKGANKPTGNTEFQFHAAGFNFKSTDYEWLVVSGPQAQYKGTGTVNGTGNYGFILTARDDAPDTFRLKVWDKDNGDAIVYDNGSNQPLGGGSIIIHTGK